MYQEIYTYLIFVDRNDIYNFTSIRCFKDELNNNLIKEEFLSPGEHYSEFSWVIFEEGRMIQG